MPVELLPHEFSPKEARRVLAHYDLGNIASATIFAAGSPQSPKVIVNTDRGVYLLKRRDPRKCDPFKVAFSHEIILKLAEHHFPVPHLIGMTETNNTMLQSNGTVYEVFEFLPSQPYDKSPEATKSAGRTLGLCHKLLADYKPSFPAPRGDYHANPQVGRILHNARKTLEKNEQTAHPLFDLAESALALYVKARDAATATGLATWPVQIVHADFHPGNALFWARHVVGVIDFDGARYQQRVIDLANSALAFSTFIDNKLPPEQWPVEVEWPRLRAFFSGYDGVILLSTGELEALPSLMIEAVLNECTLLLGDGRDIDRLTKLSPWLTMGYRRAKWIDERREELAAQLGG